METVYIETSVVSYLVARPPADTLAHQWHVWTKDWWRLRRPGFECVISAEVSREAAAGDPKASRQRLEMLSTLTELPRTPTVDKLMETFLSAGPLPAQAKAAILSRLQPVAERHGYRMPRVCTPLQLMGTLEYED
jgi:hypothetical protein